MLKQRRNKITWKSASQSGENSDPESPKSKGSTGAGCALCSRSRTKGACLSFPTHPLPGELQPRGAGPGFTSAPQGALEYGTAAKLMAYSRTAPQTDRVKYSYSSKRLQTSKHTCFSTEQQKELDFVTGLRSVFAQLRDVSIL